MTHLNRLTLYFAVWVAIVAALFVVAYHLWPPRP